MAFEVWLTFVVTEAALCLTPGPAVLLVISQGLTRGSGASGLASLGILAANLIYFGVSATGLAAVLLASYEVFALIRWVGAAYLIWLGVKAFRGRSPALCVATGPAMPAHRRRIFLNGFVLQMANPKALVFFTALLPQFIDPAQALPMQVAVLAATSVMMELIILLGYGAVAARASVIAVRPRFAALANRLAGSMLIAAGLGLARARRA